MFINSTSFLIFFVVVFFLYYFPLKEKTKAQNILLLFASYFFYGYADIKIIPLLLIATIIFYFAGIAIKNTKNENSATWLSVLGILGGVGLLAYFKYFNFFITSFSDLFNAFGLKTNWHTFNIIMPLGISFFTFKLISYVIEIHQENIEPTTNFITFATYIAFFPTIMSGPIDRPNTFIPQLERKRTFNYDLSVDGCRQILWGLFKKMVIADNIAVYVDNIWANLQNSTGSTLLLAAICYSFQVYTDFSGYSDMAIGVGKILGFKITQNFKYPFFSVNIAGYWRKWHMSLTNWVTDYVFTPLSFCYRKMGRLGTIIAIVINFLIVGIWHGANLTFVIFGLYQGLLFTILILTGAFYKKSEVSTMKSGFPVLKDLVKMFFTFILISLGNIVFRAETVNQAFGYFYRLFSLNLFSIPRIRPRIILVFILVMLAIEWLQREKEYGLQIDNIKRSILRWGIYYAIVIIILNYGSFNQSSFIYFQF